MTHRLSTGESLATSALTLVIAMTTFAVTPWNDSLRWLFGVVLMSSLVATLAMWLLHRARSATGPAKTRKKIG